MVKKLPKYIQVKNRIKEGIKNGSITGKLPGERVLAKELGVAYMTLRKALGELEEEGILHKSTTKGTFVSNSKMSPKVTKNIGFFLDSNIREGISSPYYSLIFKALEKEVKEDGYNLLLFSDTDDMIPANNQKKIDGVLVCCFPRIENKVQELKKFLPVVLLDNIATDKSIPSVTIDNFNSCKKAAEYLIDGGHKKIGFISGLLDSDVCMDRLKGYQAALEANGFPADDSLIYKGDYSYESGEKAAEYYLKMDERPTAILCANDSMAIGAMKVIQEAGLRIPNDISIIGFDDIEVASRVFPALSTNSAPVKVLVKVAMEILMAAINGEDQEYVHKILPADLVLRGSTK